MIFALDPTLDLFMIVIYHHYVLLMAGLFMYEMTKLLN